VIADDAAITQLCTASLCLQTCLPFVSTFTPKLHNTRFFPSTSITMSLSKLGVLANLALAASAVLIPSTITTPAFDGDNALEGLAIDPFKRAVTLECPGCPFATLDGETIQWSPNVGSTFVSVLIVWLCNDILILDRPSISRWPTTST